MAYTCIKLRVAILNVNVVSLHSSSKRMRVNLFSLSPVLGTAVFERFSFRGYRRTPDFTGEMAKRASVLAQAFNCPLQEACALLMKNRHITTMGWCKFDRMVKLFCDHNISLKEVFSYPDVFKRNSGTLCSRFLQLREVGIEQVKLSQVNTAQHRFTKRLSLYHKEKRARDVYSDHVSMTMSCLGCSLQEAKALLEANKVLKNSKLSTLKTKVELLLAQGVTSKALLEKPWVLVYPVSQLKTRSRFLRKHGITFKNCPKSFFHLLKCPEEQLKRNMESLKCELAVLGECSSKEEFLCKSLKCDITHINVLQKSYPKLLSVKATKLHATLTFLKQCSVPSEEIISNGRIFSFSTETIKRRHCELNELGYGEISAKMLAMDNRVYRKLVEKLKTQIV